MLRACLSSPPIFALEITGSKACLALVAQLSPVEHGLQWPWLVTLWGGTESIAELILGDLCGLDLFLGSWAGSTASTLPSNLLFSSPQPATATGCPDSASLTGTY